MVLPPLDPSALAKASKLRKVEPDSPSGSPPPPAPVESPSVVDSPSAVETPSENIIAASLASRVDNKDIDEGMVIMNRGFKDEDDEDDEDIIAESTSRVEESFPREGGMEIDVDVQEEVRKSLVEEIMDAASDGAERREGEGEGGPGTGMEDLELGVDLPDPLDLEQNAFQDAIREFDEVAGEGSDDFDDDSSSNEDDDDDDDEDEKEEKEEEEEEEIGKRDIGIREAVGVKIALESFEMQKEDEKEIVVGGIEDEEDSEEEREGKKEEEEEEEEEIKDFEVKIEERRAEIVAEAPILSGKAPLHDQSRIEDVDDDDNDDVDDSNYPGFEGKLLSPDVQTAIKLSQQGNNSSIMSAYQCKSFQAVVISVFAGVSVCPQ